MGKNKGSKKKGEKGGGAGKALVGLVVAVAAVGGALYAFAPETLRHGLQLVGIDLPM